MKKRVSILFSMALGVALLCSTANAQGYVLSQAMECDWSQIEKADEIAEQIFAPLLDQQLRQGSLQAWAYWGQYVGGDYARLGILVAEDPASLVKGFDNYRAALFGNAGTAEAAAAFLSICQGHRDTIWKIQAASAPVGDIAGMEDMYNHSGYYTCDLSRADRLAEIIEAITPALNKGVSYGFVGTWMWGSRVRGGPENYVISYRGPSHASLLEGIDKLQTIVWEQYPDEARDFTTICRTSESYMWNVLMMN